MTIHPSDPSTFPDAVALWEGTPTAGDELTQEQRASIAAYNREQAARRFRPWSGAVHKVRLEYERPWKPGSYETTRWVPCPLLHETPKSRLLITPNGERKWFQKKR